MPVGADGAIRRAALTILADHLHPVDARFWSVGLDLTAATLTDLDLSGCRIDGDLRLDYAVLLGPAKLRGVVVGGLTSLRGATVHEHAWLERSVFRGAATFDAVTFGGDAWFGQATFAGRTSFAGTEFGGHAWFGGCTFRGFVNFGAAAFRRSAGFRGALAHAGVGLGDTTFLGPARVSRRGASWNVAAPGWSVATDPDNESVGQLVWIGHPELVERPPAAPPRSARS